MSHQLVWQQSREELASPSSFAPRQCSSLALRSAWRRFREDVSSSIKLLQDITGQPVECFRAPGFSVTDKEGWAFDILADLGIKYDCSVFPAHHAHGGMTGYGAPVPSLIKHGETVMKEFSVTTKTIMGRRIIFSGGGYLASTSSIATRHSSSKLGSALAAPSVPAGAVFFD